MNNIYNTVKDIRNELIDKYSRKEFVIDKSGVKTIEIINASFIVDEDVIFGKINKNYVERELEWYNSQSLNVNDIPGEVPQIWQQVSDKDGWINSNYGWCVYSNVNFNQYDFCLGELLKNPNSRRACMLYIRPSMNVEYNKNGMSDYMCTTHAQVFIRNNKLHYLICQRSADAIFGLINDLQWHKHVHKKLLKDLNDSGCDYELGSIHYQIGSLHLYQRHFYLLHHYIKTNEINISLKHYNELYET